MMTHDPFQKEKRHIAPNKDGKKKQKQTRTLGNDPWNIHHGAPVFSLKISEDGAAGPLPIGQSPVSVRSGLRAAQEWTWSN